MEAVSNGLYQNSIWTLKTKSPKKLKNQSKQEIVSSQLASSQPHWRSKPLPVFSNAWPKHSSVILKLLFPLDGHSRVSVLRSAIKHMLNMWYTFIFDFTFTLTSFHFRHCVSTHVYPHVYHAFYMTFHSFLILCINTCLPCL